MSEFRNRVRSIILAITGFIISFLLIRFFFVLFGADQSNGLVGLIYDITFPFVQNFEGLESVLDLGRNVDASIIFAIIFYMVVGVLITEVVTSFIQDDLGDIIINIIDAIFKILEFIIISRFVLSLFGIPPAAAPIVEAVYMNTEWTQGLLPSIDFLSGELEFSTLAVLIVVVIIDFATEGLIDSLFPREDKAKKAVAKSSGGSNTVTHTTVIKEPSAPQPMPQQKPQNITIVMPQSGPPQQAQRGPGSPRV